MLCVTKHSSFSCLVSGFAMLHVRKRIHLFHAPERCIFPLVLKTYFRIHTASMNLLADAAATILWKAKVIRPLRNFEKQQMKKIQSELYVVRFFLNLCQTNYTVQFRVGRFTDGGMKTSICFRFRNRLYSEEQLLKLAALRVPCRQ